MILNFTRLARYKNQSNAILILFGSIYDSSGVCWQDLILIKSMFNELLLGHVLSLENFLGAVKIALF